MFVFGGGVCSCLCPGNGNVMCVPQFVLSVCSCSCNGVHFQPWYIYIYICIYQSGQADSMQEARLCLSRVAPLPKAEGYSALCTSIESLYQQQQTAASNLAAPAMAVHVLMFLYSGYCGGSLTRSSFHWQNKSY